MLVNFKLKEPYQLGVEWILGIHFYKRGEHFHYIVNIER